VCFAIRPPPTCTEQPRIDGKLRRTDLRGGPSAFYWAQPGGEAV